jgi:class 3 adenylate cyclase
VPVAMENHAEAAVHVAMGFINFLKDWNKERDKKNLLPFNIRLGLHSGPVCAGVVGTKKFVFDIWGDAVNIASRMESSAEPGKINISESTYDLVKHKFKCEPRGAILTKNMGELKMYYIQNY